MTESQQPMRSIHTDEAPAAIGPYAQAIICNGMVFTSGQIPLDPVTMTISGQTIAKQTSQALQNLGAVLSAAGSSPKKVVKTLVFLKNMNDFSAMNEVYAQFFGEHRPARSCVEVARLPKDVLFEIECVAQL
jgi:2-iminobutanoate/2-iminopropanoate deaminase